MANFDRFDICEAYLAIEIDYNMSGWLQERPSNVRRQESTGVQLDRIGFKPGIAWKGFESLTENGKEIYQLLESRYGLRKDAEPESVDSKVSTGIKAITSSNSQCDHYWLCRRGGTCPHCKLIFPGQFREPHY